MANDKLFPEIEPYRKTMLDVGSGHQLYVEESGNPEGIPIVFLHGGPGGGSSPKFRRLADPNHWRIIVYDQRGCGNSLPNCGLTDNTTPHLVDDLEKIRTALSVDSWFVCGGSWGVTLALCYAIRHPDRCRGLVLRGVFLCRPQDMDWLYQGGAAQIFPDAYQEFVAPLSAKERKKVVQSYYKKLIAGDHDQRIKLCQAWSRWETTVSRMCATPEYIESGLDPQYAIPIALIEAHYFNSDGFMPSANYLLDQVKNFRHIPGIIIHGRYDVVCNFAQAWELHQKWPEAQLWTVDGAGHSSSEPAIEAKLVAAIAEMRERHG